MRKVAVVVGAVALAVGLVAMSRRFDWEAQTVWSAIGALTTGLAAGVAVYLAWVEQRERVKRRTDEERSQASRVTLRLEYPKGSVTSEDSEWMVTSALVRAWNMSDLPITNAVLKVRHLGRTKPDTSDSYDRTWSVVMPDEPDVMVNVAFRVPRDESPEGYEPGVVEAELMFTDSAGRVWRRLHDQTLVLSTPLPRSG